MVAGCVGVFGGIAAWLPSVCFILISCHLEARQAAQQGKPLSKEVDAHLDETAARKEQGNGKAKASGGYEVDRDSDDDGDGSPNGGGELETDQLTAQQLQKHLGLSLASAIILILRGFDRCAYYNQR
eukprot:4087861-Pleurochrysis_carterae.AAC.1